MCTGSDLFLSILSILFPPIGVWIKRGICSPDSLINIALCCLGYLPGLLHAWYIISLYPDPAEYSHIQDSESGGQHDQPRAYVIVSGYGTVAPTPAGGQFPGQHAGGQYVGKQAGAVKAQGGGGGGGQQQQQKQNGGQESVPARMGPPAAEGEGSSGGPAPPSYADVIMGDHKVQSQD